MVVEHPPSCDTKVTKPTAVVNHAKMGWLQNGVVAKMIRTFLEPLLRGKTKPVHQQRTRIFDKPPASGLFVTSTSAADPLDRGRWLCIQLAKDSPASRMWLGNSRKDLYRREARAQAQAHGARFFLHEHQVYPQQERAKLNLCEDTENQFREQIDATKSSHLDKAC